MVTPSVIKQITHLPNHIAFIMDGNGRWAEQRGLSRFEGHQVGIERTRSLITQLQQRNIKYATLYAFSTENWRRPEAEVKGLLRLLEEALNKESAELHKKGAKLCHLGSLEGLSAKLQQTILNVTELTKNNTEMIVNFAFNYGGRSEILDAVRHLIAEKVSPQSIDEKSFSNYLYTAGLPDVDLVIRTGGEIRISNFLLWQAAYSEYYFTPILWPDFSEAELDKALVTYSQRQRRFGGLQPRTA